MPTKCRDAFAMHLYKQRETVGNAHPTKIEIPKH